MKFILEKFKYSFEDKGRDKYLRFSYFAMFIIFFWVSSEMERGIKGGQSMTGPPIFHKMKQSVTV
jgi:hypothetical protein